MFTTWFNIPAQLDAILANQRAILAQGVKLMSITSDLKDAVTALTAAVTDLTTKVTANDAAIQAEIAALQAAIAGGNPAEIQTAIDNIKTLSSSVGAAAAAVAKETSDLTASLPA